MSKKLIKLFWLLFFGFFLYKLVPKYRYLVDGLPDFMGKTELFDQGIFALHIFSGIIVYGTAVIQFTPSIRKRNISLHRKTGKLYILASFLCITSLYFMIPQGLCSFCRPSHYIVTSLWLIFVLLAFYFIKQGNVLQHQRMMISSFICAAYFVSIRVIDMLAMPFFYLITKTEGQALLVSDISVWSVPLFIFWIYWVVQSRTQLMNK